MRNTAEVLLLGGSGFMLFKMSNEVILEEKNKKSKLEINKTIRCLEFKYGAVHIVPSLLK